MDNIDWFKVFCVVLTVFFFANAVFLSSLLAFNFGYWLGGFLTPYFIYAGKVVGVIFATIIFILEFIYFTLFIKKGYF